MKNKELIKKLENKSNKLKKQLDLVNSELEELQSKPIKQGILKESLYEFNSDVLHNYQIVSETEKNNAPVFKKILNIGTLFLCYNYDGTEYWNDCNYTLQSLDNEWAKKYLENIKMLD